MCLPSPPPPFRLLVFDWDGTVMDSLSAIVDCTLHAVEDVHVAPPSASEIRAAVGLSRPESMDRLFPGTGDEERERLVDRMRHHWLTTYREQPVLIAGIREALERLAAAGYFLAVATGKGRPGLDRDLEETGLAPLFLASRTADEAASKPSPQMLLELMDELGVSPRETLMVGDTSFDLLMARNAGSAAVGVLSGSHGRRELLQCEPLDLLESAVELPDWLAERGGRPSGG